MTRAPHETASGFAGGDVERRRDRAWSPARLFADLGPRIGSSVVLGVLAILTAWLGGTVFALCWAAGGAAMAVEWQNMTGGPCALLRSGIGSVALFAAAWLTLIGFPQWAMGCLGIGALAVGAAGGRRGRMFHAAAGTGVLYAGALVVSVIVLRRSWPLGFETILWLYAVVWTNDAMAYFGGRLIGGPKLWPRVSPAKTWSGTVVGAVGGALAGALVSSFLISPPPAAFPVQFALGLLAALAAQAGDLFESALKRRFGVKDASHLIPGHGGMMDRLDGFLAAALIMAVIGVSHYGYGSAGVGVFYW